MPNNNDTNEFDAAAASVVHDDAQSTATTIRNNVQFAVGQNPDQAAQYQHLAKYTGVPVDTVRAQPDAIKQQAALQSMDADKLVSDHPTLAKYLTDQNNVDKSHDDITPLATVEQAVKALPAPAAPPPSIGDTIAGLPMEFGKALGESFSKGASSLNLALGAFPTVYDKVASLITGKPTSSASDAWFRNMVDPRVNAAPAYAVDPNARFVTKAVHTTGNLLGMLSQITLTGSGGEAAGAAGTTAEVLGNAAAHGAKSMAFPAITDSIETGRNVYAQTGDAQQAMRAAQMQYLTTTAAGVVPLSAPGNLLTRLGGGFASGVATGETSRAAMNLVLPDSMQQGFDAEGLILSGLSGSMLGGAMGPRAEPSYHQELRQTYVDASRAEASEKGMAALQALSEAAVGSKTRERDPAAFREFVQSATEDGNLKEVYVKAEDFAAALHQSGVDLPTLEERMPEVAAQLHEAAQTNGDVRIPVEDYATHIAGGELDKALLEHLKIEPDGMTYHEAQDYYTNQKAEMQKTAERMGTAQQGDQQKAADGQAVHDDVLGQLNRLNRFNGHVNQSYAALMRAFFETQAARTGQSAKDLYDQSGLQIRGQSVEDVLNQGEAHQRELIVQHNLTESNLLHAHKIGGMAVPSLAITKAAHPLLNFGEITMLGSKDMVDPKAPGNKVFGSDIYSPRYPSIGHKVDKPVLKSINEAIKPFKAFGGSEIFPSEIGHDTVRDLLERNAVKAAALAELGIDVKPVLVDGKLDEWKTTMALRNAIHDNDAYAKVEEFARGLLEKAGAKEQIFTGYSRSGNRTFVPHTLENVIKILQKELRGGENFNYGVGSIRSKYSPHFKSIDQIVKAKDRLVDDATFEKVRGEIDTEFFKVIEDLKPFHDSGATFGFSDTVAMALSDAAKSGLPRALEMNGFKDVPVEQQKAVVEFLNKLRTLPTEYFEAKALRAVPLSEFKTAVVPHDVDPRVLKALEESGITDVRTYQRSNDAERTAQIQSADHLLFQSIDRLAPPSATLAWGRDTQQKWESPWTAVKRLAQDGKVTREDVAAIKKISQGDEAKAPDSLRDLVKEIKVRPAGDVLFQSSHTMRDAAEARFDQALNEAQHWLKSNGKTANVSGLAPHEALTAVDEMMGMGSGPMSEEAKAQGRAVWDRLNEAHKRLDRFINPDRYAPLDLANIKEPADVATWSESAQKAWKPQWAKLKKLAKDGRVTEDDLAKVEKFTEHPASAAVRLNQLTAEIRKRPADDNLYQSGRTIEVDGERRPITNSKGQPVADSFEKQQAFYKWFGKSAVVDEQGRPLVVYHGTDVADQFDSFAPGSYFTTEPREGSAYTFAGDFARRQRATGKYTIATGQEYAGKLTPYYGAISEISRPEIGQVYATDNGVFRFEGSGKWSVFSDLAVDYDHGDADRLRVIKSDAGAEARALVDEYEQYVREIAPRGDGGRVLPVYLNIKNPVRLWALEANKLGIRLGATKESIAEAIAKYESQGYDGIVTESDDVYMNSDLAKKLGKIPTQYIIFHPEQIKSATGNDGTFDANDPSILSQAHRGAYDPKTATLALFKAADMSTFLHESGHFFLETSLDLAARPNANEAMRTDATALLSHLGIEATPEMSALDRWSQMNVAEKRAAHEQFAVGFEKYLMEGKAPTIELQGLFSRFRSWLINVYKNLAGLDVKLSPEVRGIMDRMLASDEAIREAEQTRKYRLLFETPESAEASRELFDKYEALGTRATEEAIADMTGRSMRDMQWSSNAKAKALKVLQADVQDRRASLRQQVSKEVMAQPVYQAWQFLTLRGNTDTKAEKPNEFKLAPEHVDTRTDNLFAAIAKMGGLNRDEIKRKWGVDHKDMPDSGVFGKPIVRKTGGLSIDRMAEKLVEQHYLDQHDLAEFEDKFDRQRSGQDQYSWEYQHSNGERPPADPIGDSNFHGKLDTKDLRYMFGEDSDTVRALIKKRMTSEKTGLFPDIVAEMVGGFESGREMIEQLLAARPPHEVINEMTDQRMLEQHGELTDPAAIERAAEEAVHNDTRARFMATGLKILTKSPIPARQLVKAAREAAEAAVAAKRVRDLRPNQYLAAEARSTAEALKLAPKDPAGAVRAQRAALLNNQLFKAADGAVREVQKNLKYLARFDRATVRAKIDLEYRDQIDELLDRYDLRKSVSGKELDKRESLNAFVERMAAAGYEPQIPEKLLNEAQRTHYKEMTVEEFAGLVEAIKSIDHLGRLKTKLLDGREAREIDELANEARAVMDTLPQRGDESNRGLGRIDGAMLKMKSAGRSMQSALLKMEQMMDWLDDRNPNGVFNRVVFRRIADAGVREADMQARVKAEIDQLLHSNLADVTRDKNTVYVAPGLIDGLTGKAQRFTKKEMLALAGNMGNESNMGKLLRGERWDEAAVWDFLDKNMSKADWDFVAGLGRTLESLWPEKLAMSRRLGSTNPDKIAPRPFDTKHGRYEGWYWPMVYDPARSQDAAERGAKDADALFENIYARANTDTGRMNTRKEGYARPLLLSLDTIPRIIRDEIHDIAYREAIMDADKFLRNGKVRKAIMEALSPEHYDQLRPWLQSIANDRKVDMAALKWFDALAHGARTRATIVGLGYRISTMLVHGGSAAMESVAELGPVWFGKGLGDFANPKNWAANRDFVFERSGEMRNRMNEVDRDVREHLREIDLRLMDTATGAVARGADLMKAHAYQGIAMLDMASALPTWMGAYHKAMAPAGKGGLDMNEADAVYFADKTVRNAHGGTGVKDQAAVQRGPEFFKLFTMFYTFWNHNINRLMDTGRMAGDARTWRDTGKASTVIMRFLIYTLGIQTMHGLLHPKKDEEGETHWLAWAAEEMGAAAFSGIPILRDLAAHFITGKDYSVTPAAGMVDAIGKTGIDVAHALTGKETDPKVLKHSITTAGYVLGLPLGQPASTAQFLWDVTEGRQQPQDAADWWHGIIHGDMRRK